MNVYQKLAEARVRFQSGNPKMSGENTFAKYKYFELSDILPIINRLGNELGFVCEVSFTAELATLVFRDTEKPESFITFTSPMSTASLKGCHEVQNLGAVETYVKRYLYQNAFEIVENDALNRTQGSDSLKPQKEQAPQEDVVSVKNTLLDWMAVTPPVFNDAWMKYADKVAKANDLEGMKTAIAEAKKQSQKGANA